jgi:hypothetical protein
LLILTTGLCSGEAEAKKDSTIAEALAEEQRMQAKLVNDTEIARAKRDYELNKAKYDTEVSYLFLYKIITKIKIFHQIWRKGSDDSCIIPMSQARVNKVFDK